MDKIVRAVAEDENISFAAARDKVMLRMEERALEAERKGLNSRTMWVQYAKMAMNARPPHADAQN
jgi:hypothetical protein